jgi:galactonate dehydratase
MVAKEGAVKITGVRTFVVGNPPPGFGGRYFVFLKLLTDGGIDGLGEVYGVPFHPRVVEHLIVDVIERCVIGREVSDIERIWRSVYSSGFSQRPDITVAGLLSGIEMACWDILGKDAGLPVYRMLGGQVHEKLRSYTYLYPKPGDPTDVYADPVLAAERAVEYVATGFTAIKFDPAGPYTAFDGRQLGLPALARSETFVRLLREAVGNRADLLFGSHGQMTAAGAIRLARRLEPYDPLWFEEPIPPDNPRELAKVARGTSIPIATGERLATKYEFVRLLEEGAAAILQLNLGRVGGILEGKKIASMAEAYHVQIAPHLYCGPVVGAANVQLATCSPNFLILESILGGIGFHAEILSRRIEWQDGFIVPPTAPGLGVELDEQVAARHPYTGAELHLEMAHHPVID